MKDVLEQKSWVEIKFCKGYWRRDRRICELLPPKIFGCAIDNKLFASKFG